MNARLTLVLLLCLPAAYAHAEEPEGGNHGGFAGVSGSWSTSTLEVSGFTDPTVSGGTAKHVHAAPGLEIAVGYRGRYFRVAGVIEAPDGLPGEGIDPSDLTSTHGNSTVATTRSGAWLTLDGILPMGKAGGAFGGIGYGALNYETVVVESGSEAVLDHADFVSTLHAGWLYDWRKLTFEAAAKYVFLDENQASGRYRVKTTTGLGGWFGVKYSF